MLNISQLKKATKEKKLRKERAGAGNARPLGGVPLLPLSLLELVALVAYESGRKDRPILANPDSGIREIFACGIRNPPKEKNACVIRNPGLWNTEYSSRNPESH